MTTLRALWLALLFVLMGFHVRFGIDGRKNYGPMKIYLHIGKQRVTEPVCVMVHPRGYKVISVEEQETNDRHDTFMTAFIELHKFA